MAPANRTQRHRMPYETRNVTAKPNRSHLSCQIREYLCLIRLLPQPQPQPQPHSQSLRALCSQHVPLLVELCTALIEARGLDSIGIYRVPGNATALALIQEEFAQVCASSVLCPHLRTRLSHTPRHSFLLHTLHTFRFVYVLLSSVFSPLSTTLDCREASLCSRFVTCIMTRPFVLACIRYLLYSFAS